MTSRSGARGLSGQWMGKTEGEYAARVMMDLDPFEGAALGLAHLFPEPEGLPCAFAVFNHADIFSAGKVESSVTYFHPGTGYIPSRTELAEVFPEVELSWNVTIDFEPIGEDHLKVLWTTESGISGSGSVQRMALASRSSLIPQPEISDWRDFQSYVTEQSMDGFLYRGQSFPWPLQTSFHRTPRKNLHRYLNEDIQLLHRALTGRTRHLFDLEKPQESGAFLNLAQHHGYPTPLLDWTLSPFVAAYFACVGVDSIEESDPPMRIIAFDQKRFRRRWEQVQALSLVKPHFSILDALTIENDRAVPQQGVLTLTNLHDIEAYIAELEQKSSDRYLFAFDIPRRQAPEILRHLRLMGITQATLFPGIDSICREMRHRNF